MRVQGLTPPSVKLLWVIVTPPTTRVCHWACETAGAAATPTRLADATRAAMVVRVLVLSIVCLLRRVRLMRQASPHRAAPGIPSKGGSVHPSERGSTTPSRPTPLANASGVVGKGSERERAALREKQ